MKVYAASMLTKDTLRKLREDRGWTRNRMAEELGGISASAIVHWEGGNREIPAWVEDKLFRQIEVAFPLPLLKELIDIAIAEDTNFEQLLAAAIRDYLAARRQPSVPAPGINETPAMYAVGLLPVTAQEKGLIEGAARLETQSHRPNAPAPTAAPPAPPSSATAASSAPDTAAK